MNHRRCTELFEDPKVNEFAQLNCSAKITTSLVSEIFVLFPATGPPGQLLMSSMTGLSEPNDVPPRLPELRVHDRGIGAVDTWNTPFESVQSSGEYVTSVHGGVAGTAVVCVYVPPT